MNPQNRPVWLTIAGGLFATSIATLTLIFRGDGEPPYWANELCITSAVLGLVIFGALLFPTVDRATSFPLRWSKKKHASMLQRKARYRQGLICRPNGHEYKDVVALVTERSSPNFGDLLPVGGGRHTCPECGSEEAQGSAFGIRPMNRAARRAERLGYLAYSPRS